MRMFIRFHLLIVLIVTMSSAGYALDPRDKQELVRLGSADVWAAIHYKLGSREKAQNFFSGPIADYRFIDTLITRAPASQLIDAMSADFYDNSEIIADAMVRTVTELLGNLYRVELLEHINYMQLGVLNLSVGPPRDLVNKRRSGEETVARAYEHVISTLDLPIVASAGNDGPMPGMFNAWANAVGTIVGAAADSAGTHIMDSSSRQTSYDGTRPFKMFAAWGENTVGAWPENQPKTPEMLAVEKTMDLASIVGADKVQYYSVMSGTSFAAASISRLLCFPQQMSQVLGAYLSSTANLQYPIAPFVRGYIDIGIDANHPIFENRLIDRRKKYGGLMIQVDIPRKQHLLQFLESNGVDIHLRYGRGVAVRFLKEIARPIVSTEAIAQGEGFVSFDAAVKAVGNARYSTLIKLFSDEADGRKTQWLADAEKAGDPALLSPDEAQAIANYCDRFDLVFPLSLSSQ